MRGVISAITGFILIQCLIFESSIIESFIFVEVSFNFDPKKLLLWDSLTFYLAKNDVKIIHKKGIIHFVRATTIYSCTFNT